MTSSAPARSSGMKGGFLALLVIVLLVVGAGAAWKFSMYGLGGNLVATRAQWQAVFLANGQVYFGKVVKSTPKVVVLKNIYYLQVVTQPLQRSAEADEATEPQTEQRLTLIKLGNEIHGPNDEMTINWDQVVLVEDLKDDGRVVQAINEYVSQQ